MRTHRHIRKPPISEINVVPYIDVMLVLLIIFMVTAPLLQYGVEVELPGANTVSSSESDKEPLVININKKGEIFSTVGDNPKKPITLELLKAQAAAFQRVNPKLPIYIGGDKEADYGDVVAVFVALQSVGKDKVFLMTEPLEH